MWGPRLNKQASHIMFDFFPPRGVLTSINRHHQVSSVPCSFADYPGSTARKHGAEWHPDDGWEQTISTAAPGSTVLFQEGICQGNCSTLRLQTNLTLSGIEGASKTVLNCQGAGRHIYISNSASISIQGLPLSNEETNADGCTMALDAILSIRGIGGAVFAVESSLVIDEVEFVHNRAREGGAIALAGGTARVNLSVFSRNEALENGGAVQLTAASRMECTQCVMSENIAASRGGAAHVDSSRLVLVEGELRGNVARRGGGLE
eukprot:950969-Rhodomonas_salina.1